MINARIAGDYHDMAVIKKSEFVMRSNVREREILRSVVAILRKHLAPGKIVLFGSRAEQNHSPGSDFDFAVDRKRPVAERERRMMDEIEDVAGLYGIDIVYLQETNHEFRSLVLKTGKVLYERKS